MNPAAQKSAGGQHHGARAEFNAHLRHHAGDAVAFDDQIIDALLKYREAFWFSSSARTAAL